MDNGEEGGVHQAELLSYFGGDLLIFQSRIHRDGEAEDEG